MISNKLDGDGKTSHQSESFDDKCEDAAKPRAAKSFGLFDSTGPIFGLCHKCMHINHLYATIVVL